MTPTPEEIAKALPHVRYEIESLLQTPDYDRTNKALEESVYFRKMAHCRALYHFFRKEAGQRVDRRDRIDDDIVSEDFGFPARDVYGSNAGELLKRFNKDLLHLTYERLKHTPNSKPWQMDVLFPPVAQRAREFIDHILMRFSGNFSDQERKLWADLKSNAGKGMPCSRIPQMWQNPSYHPLKTEAAANKITGANAGGPRQLPLRARWAACVAQFCRSHGGDQDRR